MFSLRIMPDTALFEIPHSPPPLISEGRDRQALGLALPGKQNALVWDAIAAARKQRIRVVALLFVAGPVDPALFAEVPISWPAERPAPRCNFDTLLEGLLCTFLLLEGEGWNGAMFEHYRATRSKYGAMPPIYFLIVYILGNLFLLNLFVAILLSNFTRGAEALEGTGVQGPAYVEDELDGGRQDLRR